MSVSVNVNALSFLTWHVQCSLFDSVFHWPWRFSGGGRTNRYSFLILSSPHFVSLEMWWCSKLYSSCCVSIVRVKLGFRRAGLIFVSVSQLEIYVWLRPSRWFNFATSGRNNTVAKCVSYLDNHFCDKWTGKHRCEACVAFSMCTLSDFQLCDKTFFYIWWRARKD